MNQPTELHELLRVILNETEKIFDVEGTSILLEDKETGNLRFFIATGEKKDVLNSIQMKKGQGVCGYVYDSGEILVENDPSKSQFFSDEVDKKSKFVTRNLLCVPLKVENTIIGVIELVNKKKGNFLQSDVEFLDAIASQVSITLERARLIEEKIKAEKLATIGETVAGLAHYIKNILNGLKGGSYIIEKNIDKIESDKVRAGWKMVEKNINKISSLALDMLQYSKEREPEYEDINVNSLIKDAIELNKQKTVENNISIEEDLQSDMKEIQIDAQGIFRCILNLVNNSTDALKDVKNATLRISSTQAHNRNVRIEIHDNGCGIKKELLDKLFTKFFSTKGSKGTGLGLPVTKKIIEEHNGSIYCVSELNKGTTFIIDLPGKINK